MSQHVYKPTVTTSSGAWSGSTMNIVPGIVCQVYVKPTSTDTVYDLTITDANSVDRKKYTDVIGELNDVTKWPIQGVTSFSISSATNDEAFTLQMVVEEF